MTAHRSAEASNPTVDLQRVDFDPVSAVLKTAGPARRFRLVAGEQISGELIQYNRSEATLVIRGQQRITVPASVLRGIDSFPGERDLFYDDFEGASKAWTAQQGRLRTDRRHQRSGQSALMLPVKRIRLEYRPSNPLPAGRISFCFYQPTPVRQTQAWGLELEFLSEKSTSVVRCRFGVDRHGASVDGPWTRAATVQRIPPRAGWRQLTVLFDGNRFRALIDTEVLVSAGGVPGSLAAVRIVREPQQMSHADPPQKSPPEATVWIDDFQIGRFVAPASVSRFNPAQDVVLLGGGDELYGKVSSADAHSVQVDGVFGNVTFPWRRVKSLSLRPASDGPATWIQGVIARVEFQRPVDHRPGPSDVLVGTVESGKKGQIVLHHPLLGTLRLPTEHIRRIEPRYRGRLQWLEPDVHHLGDEVRAGFRRTVPEGTRLSGCFRLQQLPAAAVFLSLEVAELEPAGEDTLPNNPFLADLKAGFLRTDAFVNGHYLGDVNRRIPRRYSTEEPHRIRIPVPDRFLKNGHNTWHFEQRPARSDPRDFDDCELGPIALEIEQ